MICNSFSVLKTLEISSTTVLLDGLATGLVFCLLSDSEAVVGFGSVRLFSLYRDKGATVGSKVGWFRVLGVDISCSGGF